MNAITIMIVDRMHLNNLVIDISGLDTRISDVISSNYDNSYGAWGS